MSSLLPRMDMSSMGSTKNSTTAECVIRMIWNWETIDACFVAESWHITSHGMFAGSCLGIMFLAIAVEFVRKAHREYDRAIVRQWKEARLREADNNSENNNVSLLSSTDSLKTPGVAGSKTGFYSALFHPIPRRTHFRPTALQQLVRSAFYFLQFVGAYFLMLTAMFFNGYLIICIFIGAFIGYFLFGADNMANGMSQETAAATCC